MTNKIDFLIISTMYLATSNLLAGIGSCIFIIYYASLLKINVVDVKYNGNWLEYFKNTMNIRKRLK